MSDTWRQNAIVQAIQIIADKKIAQAGYDKTIKGIINKVLDSASGKYQVRYQDSLFEAYATSSKITYNKDQEVSVLIPGNDWDRVKTILGGVSSNAINYQQVPIVSDTYNAIGPNGGSLSQEIQLSSYVNQSVVLIDGQGISFKDIASYIKKGDSIALGMKVRTALADGQIGGNYGLKFNLLFKDSVTGNQIIKSFEVDTSDVIGHPYQLTNSQWVETLITGVETDNFIGIDSIEAFCNDFPQNENKADIKDIFISDIKINGADALSDSDLTGIILHINDSEKGNVLSSTISEIPLVAELKVNGKTTTENVVYYWFRQNGMVFRGDTGKYSGYAGDGWECLNYYSGNSFVPKSNGNFSFNSIEDNLANNSALAPQRVTKVLCVAVYDNKQWVKGQIQIINSNISNNIRIAIKENDVQTGRTVYYLDNGNPNLVCQTDLSGDLEYTWSVKPARGRGEKVEQDNQFINRRAAIVAQWNRVSSNTDRMAPASAEQYKNTNEYKNAKTNYDNIKLSPFVSGDTYYNFSISSIVDYSVISCAVAQNGNYKGTASVTLYNKTQLEGMYSLNLEYGTQVFQYDGKGNSPASPQVERSIEIQPLSFTLIDNEGKEISYDQIINNGEVKWIIPNTQTLLSSVNNGTGINGNLDLTVTRADLPLAADHYTVYSNLKSFSYAIADQYDAKKDINYIWLHIKYKDFEFDAYTNFTFPKDGDPGTNGTDYVAKIVPSTNTDRIYISDKAPTTIFDDNGATVANLKFQLYNNSIKVSESANYWNCPPTIFTDVSEAEEKRDKRINLTTYLAGNSAWTNPKLNVFGKTLTQIRNEKPVNIIRGQYGTGSDQNALKYFAEYPVCTEFVNTGYRLKIKPKTGFQYAVYLEDGTRPDYDNTMPFEVIVQKANSSYWEIDNTDRTYTWYAIGNIEPSTLSGKQASFKPKNTFTGDDLTSAVVCEVSGVGRIHVPIYMILNRYGHNALNGWDGNSIQLNANGNTILAPQIGAGHKQDDNSYTGVFMGSIRGLENSESVEGAAEKGLDTRDNKTGFMGYHHGQRTIFLDAETGKAEFGKNKAGKIILDPNQKINGKEKALIYSNEYPIKDFLAEIPGADVQAIGQKYKDDRENKGMMIDLSTPQIGFGNGNFTVNKQGHLIARGGGQIAGWSITDTKLHKDGKVGMASSNQIVPTSINLKNGDNDTVAFWAGGSLNENETLKDANFYTTHGGYLYSKLGRIAKWNIDDNIFEHVDKKVGMGSGSSKIFRYTNSNSTASTVNINNPRFWAINGEKQFIVDNNGKFWANEGQIGPWALDKEKLTNGYTGFGSNIIDINDMNNAFGTGTVSNNVQARIWASTTGTNKSINYVVTNNGTLYSKAGKIGGWNIEKDKLWSVNKNNGNGIRINADGSMSGGQGNGNGGGWAINTNGTSSFYGINAHTGEIGGCTISAKGISSTNWHIYPDGLAQFSNIDVTGGTIKLGGTTISASSFNSSGQTFRSGGLSTIGGSGGSGGSSNIASNLTGTSGNSWGNSDTLQDHGERAATNRAALWGVVGARKVSAGIFTAQTNTTNPQLIVGQQYVTANESGLWVKHGEFRVDSNVTINFGGLTGKTGNIYFSDGSRIQVQKGIIVGVYPGSDVNWG